MDIFSSPLVRAKLSRLASIMSNHSGQDEVISPLGVWLVLGSALAGRAEEVLSAGGNPDPIIEMLHEVTGAGGVTEFSEAVAYLTSSSDDGGVSVHAWGDSSVDRWLRGAQMILDVSFNLPSQAEADKWVTEATHGLITSMPVDLSNPDLAALIASTVTMDVKWKREFSVVDASEEDRNLGAAGMVEDAANRWGIEKVLSADILDSSSLSVLSGSVAPGGNVTKLVVKAVNGDEVHILAPESDEFEADAMYDLILNKDHMFQLAPEGLRLQDVGAGFTEVKTIESNEPSLKAVVPAWEVKTDVSEFGDIADRVGKVSFPNRVFSLGQSTVAQFKAEGFAAASLTYGYVLRAAMSAEERECHTFIPSRRFAFVAYRDGVPMFMGVVSSDSFIEG